jgi:hypothetical protein
MLVSPIQRDPSADAAGSFLELQYEAAGFAQG